MFKSLVNWASKQTGFSDAWSGGNWRDRLPDLSGTPNFGSPNYPGIGDKGALSWLSDKTTEGLTALATPGSGIHRLGTNVEATWKSIYEGVEYPQRTWDQWTRLDLANTGTPGGDDDVSDSPSGDSGGGPVKPNVTNINITGALDLDTTESERERAERMRRMLAGRYGRGETKLTGGTGFGSGSQRTLGGYA